MQPALNLVANLERQPHLIRPLLVDPGVVVEVVTAISLVIAIIALELELVSPWLPSYQ